MDTVTLVDDQVKDGRRLLERLAREGINVLAGAWVKPADEDRWSLYIATPLVDEKGHLAAYREVLRILRTLGNGSVSASVVKLVGAVPPIAKDLHDLARQHSGAVPSQFRRPLLGGLPVDDVYVYPPVLPRDTRSDLGLRRLISAVQQQPRPEDYTAPFTEQEQHAFDQLETSGMTSDQAKFWILERRRKERALRSIPAGTIVKADYAAWWGDKPENDPNPLLQIEAGDGAQGLTFLDNTEPV